VNDDSWRAAYAQLLADRGAGRAGCASPEALLAVAERAGPEAERLATLRHVGGCRRCRAELDLLRVAVDVGVRMARPRRAVKPALAAAAVLVVAAGALGIWQRAQPPIADTPRGTTPAGAVRLIGPNENVAVAPPLTLVWASVAGASRYEIEVLTTDGVLAYGVATSDTVAPVPDDRLTAGVEYRWWVRAVMPDGSQPRSPTRRLRVTIE
jgi:hypothetical protein